jgi:hypothetical protein
MSEQEAKSAIEDYFEAFNAQDENAMRAKLHFPFSWIINNRVRLVMEAGDFVAPTVQLIKQEGWAYSRLDWMEAVQVWDDKAHIKLSYSRYKADGTRYVSHEALWIVTRRDGHWGVQCQSLHLS